jgi:hypothetical protein
MKHAKRSHDTLASQSRRTFENNKNREQWIARVKATLGMTGWGGHLGGYLGFQSD